MATPKSIGLSENPPGLMFEWDDGHKSAYAYAFLRKACPCAVCKGERTPFDQNPLALPAFKPMPDQAYDAKDLFKIGRYAVGLLWGDGHNTGIYTFDYLRAMCPCPDCVNQGLQ